METTKDTQSTWENKDKYVILGFSRCGNTSLSKYLQCAHPEIGYNGTEEYLRVYPQCIPVFIIRNPVDRIWSLYHFFDYFKRWDFERFLDFKNERWHGVGCNDVIEQSNYAKYIESFIPYDAVVYRFEEIIKRSDFPKDWRGQHTPKITDKYRDIIQDRLDKAGITY